MILIWVRALRQMDEKKMAEYKHFYVCTDVSLLKFNMK